MEHMFTLDNLLKCEVHDHLRAWMPGVIPRSGVVLNQLSFH